MQVGQLPDTTLFNLIFIKSLKCLLLKCLQAAGANGPPCLSGSLEVDFHLLIKSPCKVGRVVFSCVRFILLFLQFTFYVLKRGIYLGLGN